MSELIPRAVLFGNPERTNAQLSPDGRRLAFTAPVAGVLNLFVGSIDNGEYKAVTSDIDRGIRTYLWAANSRHLLYLQDRGGDENWRLHSVDADTGVDVDLTPLDGVQARPTATSHRRPDELLLALNQRDPRWHDVYRVNLATGALEQVEVNDHAAAGYIADLDLDIRVCVRATPDGGTELLFRDKSEWRRIRHVDFGDSLSVVGFGADTQYLYLLSSQGANANRLLRIEVGTGAEAVIASDATYDISRVLTHPQTREPQAVAVTRDRLEWMVLDPDLQSDFDRLQAAEPGDLSIITRSDDDTRWLVAYSRDIASTAYYLYDRPSGQARLLFRAHPDLDNYPLAAMEPFSFTARDGLTIHGYLTFPADSERRALPAVVNVHGGPWARDIWGYNAEAQWLANRGYVCVQVNYRGSSGYGKTFSHAGDKEWGGKMHTDLIDAVEHLSRQGWIDPQRVAIMGGSYGGYAALCGATFTPDVFCCAVDLVGPSSIKTLIESVPPYWVDVARNFRLRAGDPDTEPDFVAARSPLHAVDNIRIPLLIAQGANDPRVKRSESEQVVAALEAKGIPHTYLLFEDEGHGFAKPENQQRFRQQVEAFLAAHVGGRAEP